MLVGRPIPFWDGKDFQGEIGSALPGDVPLAWPGSIWFAVIGDPE